jgi:putative ABC transport system substrate-binding protein
MRRRAFIKLIGGVTVAWPLAAHAQQSVKVPRVGILSPASSEAAPDLTAFRERLHDLGYIEGQTIALDFRLSNGIMEALPGLAEDLVRVPVDVIVTVSTSATLAAFDATRTIPIVMGATGGDPVGLGMAKSLARPGGNVTGTNFLSGLSEKRLQLLKLAFPGVQRVAVLANPKQAITVSEMPKAETAAARIGVSLLPLSAGTPAELQALGPSALSGSDGLLVLPDAMLHYNRATIISLASNARVPAIYPEREYADDGGLMAYGANVLEHLRQAGGYVDRILRGAKPADLPINASSKFDFVVNLRTARALGLTPSPEFLSTADEVIEWGPMSRLAQRRSTQIAATRTL